MRRRLVGGVLRGGAEDAVVEAPAAGWHRVVGADKAIGQVGQARRIVACGDEVDATQARSSAGRRGGARGGRGQLDARGDGHGVGDRNFLWRAAPSRLRAHRRAEQMRRCGRIAGPESQRETMMCDGRRALCGASRASRLARPLTSPSLNVARSFAAHSSLSLLTSNTPQSGRDGVRSLIDTDEAARDIRMDRRPMAVVVSGLLTPLVVIDTTSGRLLPGS